MSILVVEAHFFRACDHQPEEEKAHEEGGEGEEAFDEGHSMEGVEGGDAFPRNQRERKREERKRGW